MYGLQPASRVRAIESTSFPDIPKSHNFIFPLRSNKILDGFTSLQKKIHNCIISSYKTLSQCKLADRQEVYHQQRGQVHGATTKQVS